MNIWFHGGGYACIWSFGVAQAFKKLNISVDNIGGYSAGALVATFLCNPHSCVDLCLKSCYDGPYGPNKGRISLLGRHEKNMACMGNATAGNPLDWNLGHNFNGRLWIPIRGLKSFKGTWRTKYRSYDDLIECIVATGCIPGVSGEFSRCYYDDAGDRRGPSIDGGLFSLSPPAKWVGKNIIVSPWGKGDLNMNPRASLKDIVSPSLSALEKYYALGLEQGQTYCRNLLSL